MSVALNQSSSVVDAKYALLQKIGCGGSSSVFEAEDLRDGRRVALKLLGSELADNPVLARSFLEEAEVAARLAHPNVVRILDAGFHPSGQPYLVMELLEGETLEQILYRRSRLPVAYACELMLQVLAAVAAAHDSGIVHCDLKPANVVVTQLEPDRPKVTVLDFGLARRFSAGEPVAGSSQSWLGTPLYMAPEQAFVADVDFRADVFSVCAMLYELLAGRPPFVGEKIETLLTAAIRGEFVPLREMNPAVPPALARTIEAGLAGDRERRLSNVWELARRIAPFMAISRSADDSLVPFPLLADKRRVPLNSGVFETEPNPNAAPACEPTASFEVEEPSLALARPSISRQVVLLVAVGATLGIALCWALGWF